MKARGQYAFVPWELDKYTDNSVGGFPFVTVWLWAVDARGRVRGRSHSDRITKRLTLTFGRLDEAHIGERVAAGSTNAPAGMRD